MIETRTAFARRIGVHKSQITRAAQAGRLVLTADGRVNVEASIERWHATKGGRDDVAARHAANRGGAVLGQVLVGNAPSGPDIATSQPLQPGAQPDDGESGGRIRLKAMAIHFANQSIKLEMALQRGLRYPLAAVGREAQALGSTFRAAMERIIDQTAPRLAIMATDLERRRLLDAELARLRWMLKSELPLALRRMRAAGAAKPKEQHEN